MALRIRTTCFDARLIRGLVGTTITTYDLVSDGASPESTSLALSSKSSRDGPSFVTPSALAASPETAASLGISRTWVLKEKLSERAVPMTDHNVNMGRGSSQTVGKFLCHLTEDLNQVAQAVPPGVCGELDAFKQLQSECCSAVPRFLGHAESTQGDHNLVPKGYIRYLVWEKVPGEPLTTELF
ncbi:hypothetical protein N7507_011485 [Penicillium longicatenatum]|nr:hypothetical protein N7507_011485 [Penicillium longicatenatum]